MQSSCALNEENGTTTISQRTAKQRIHTHNTQNTNFYSSSFCLCDVRARETSIEITFAVYSVCRYCRYRSLLMIEWIKHISNYYITHRDRRRRASNHLLVFIHHNRMHIINIYASHRHSQMNRSSSYHLFCIKSEINSRRRRCLMMMSAIGISRRREQDDLIKLINIERLLCIRA